MDSEQTNPTPPERDEEEIENIGESSDESQNGGAIAANFDPTVAKYMQERVDVLARQEELREQIKIIKEIIKKQNEELMKQSKTIRELKASRSQMKKKRADVIKEFNRQKEISQSIHEAYDELSNVIEGINNDKKIINEEFDKIVNVIELSELLLESTDQEHRQKVETLNLKIDYQRKLREQINQSNKELQEMFDGTISDLKDQLNFQNLKIESKKAEIAKVAELKNEISIKRESIQKKNAELNKIHEKMIKFDQDAAEYKLKHQKKLISYKEKIESLQRKSKELTDETKTVVENTTTIEAEGNDLQQQIEHVQREVNIMRELIKVTEDDIELKKSLKKELENQKTSMLNVVEANEIKIQQRRVANVNYENEMKAVKEKLANLDKKSKQEDEKWEKEKKVLLDTIVLNKNEVLKRKEDLSKIDCEIANLESQIANIKLEIEKDEKELKDCENQAEKRALAHIEKCQNKLDRSKIELKEKNDKIETDNIEVQILKNYPDYKSTELVALDNQIVELKNELEKLSNDEIDSYKLDEASTDEPGPSKNQSAMSPTFVHHADSSDMEASTSGFTRNPRTASLRKRFNNNYMELDDSSCTSYPDSPEYTPQKSTTNKTAHSSKKKKRQFKNL